MGLGHPLWTDAHAPVGEVRATRLFSYQQPLPTARTAPYPPPSPSLALTLRACQPHPRASVSHHRISFYRIIGATPELYDPGSVGRALGYNGLIIAILGDAMNPALMSLAQTDATSTEQLTRFTNIKIVLLCLLLPVSIALPYYLRTCAVLNPHRKVDWATPPNSVHNSPNLQPTKAGSRI